MKSRITDGLNENDAQNAKYEYEKAFRFRQRLAELLQKDIDTAVVSMTKEDHFDSPSWALIQADRIAQIKTYRKIIALIE
jgi:hypothetical protein